MKKEQKGLKRIKTLVLILILTIVLAITSTYAWFSSQRDVEVKGMKLNVEVAENLQISLDGEHWVQSIKIDNMRQFYGTYSDTTKHQAKKDDNTNYIPTELKPVSTIGEVVDGKLQFMTGEAVVGSSSTSVIAQACSENDLTVGATIAEKQAGNSSHPYLVFDMYLRNLSKKTSDQLVLNIGSRVWVDDKTIASQEGTGVVGTGLENCARVAFIPYGNTANTTEDGDVIRALTSNGTEKAAIWEPNDLAHTDDAVNNSKRNVANGVTMPTYGIKYSTNPVAVIDVESTNDALLSEQKTIKTPYDDTVGVTERTNMTDTTGNLIELPGNQVTKVRVYIWLEGQDVDCLNTASFGDRLQATIKLTKPQNNSGTQNTYTGDGSDEENDGKPDTSKILTAADITVEDYGGSISNYSSKNGANVGWKIFHSDGSNIYLISDNYVTNQYRPTGKGGTTYNSSYGSYGANLNSRSDYTGASDITSSNPAKKWLSKFTYTSTSNNIRSTAYLMDTNVWSNFTDNEGHAEYAIGGPTIELFAASYNRTHTTKTIETQASKTGYTVKWNDEEYNTDGDNFWIEGLSKSENLYIINDSYGSTVFGMWLASPSAVGGNYMINVTCDGLVDYDSYTYNKVGIRPIVVLKNSTKIQKQNDGTYKIQ